MKTLTSYRERPLAIWQDLQNEMNRLFGRGLGQEIEFDTFGSPLAFEELQQLGRHTWAPRVDIREEANQYVVLADVPGVDPKHIQVSVDNNRLIIKGEHTSEKTFKEKSSYTRTERCCGTFYRSFILPDTADGTKISAKCKNGVLELTLPKKTSNTTKQIDVKVES